MPSPHIVVQLFAALLRKYPSSQLLQVTAVPLIVHILQLVTARLQFNTHVLPFSEYGIVQLRQLLLVVQLMQLTSAQSTQVKVAVTYFPGLHVWHLLAVVTQVRQLELQATATA